LPFRFSQELNALRASIFQKLLARYRAGKVQYQDLKKELEKLSGELGTPYFESTSAVLPALIPPLSDSASLIASLESQLANSVSATTVESLKRKHAEELQDLQTQAARAQGLEVDLAKAQEAESSLRLEFDCRLAEERKILSAEFDSKVKELHATLGSKVENRDAQITELQTLRGLDSEHFDKEIGAWRARDRKVQSGLLGLEEALRGILPVFFLGFCPFMPSSHPLAALAGAFPDSDECAAAALKEFRAEQGIIPSSDPKAELSSGELVALAKGRLHPAARLGKELHEALVSVFETLWPGRAAPGGIRALLQWVLHASNRLDIWKESAARASAQQALEFVLSWYPGVNLDQLENLREGGLAGLDRAKLCQRTCAIAECTETNALFDAGDSDESLDGMDFEEPDLAEGPQKALEDPVGHSIPPSPSGNDFVLASRAGDITSLEPAGPPSAP
jgi:hypothetical protein